MGKPDFIIPGFARCGTTALRDRLETHPDVFMAKRSKAVDDNYDVPLWGRKWTQRVPKEISYFDRMFKHLPYQWYYDHFPDDGRICGEKSPGLLQDLHNMLGIRNMFGQDIKFIILLRNPITRWRSVWFHNHKEGKGVWKKPPEEEFDLNSTRCRLFQNVITTSMFDVHITGLFSMFPEAPKLFVYHEEFRKDNEATMRKVCDFLGLKQVQWKPWAVPPLQTTHPRVAKQLKEFYRPSVQRLYELLGHEQILAWDII